MRHRHPVPSVWMMTDERIGDGLWAALDRLPRGAGVVFRHYGLPAPERRSLLAEVATVARRRRLVLIAAGIGGPDGSHNRRAGRGLHTRSAHDRRQIVAAIRDGADAIFVSPVFATRSHPGARPLGARRLGTMIRGVGLPVIALGGMDAHRFRGLRRLGLHGWAGIDAWSAPDQKRKAVPT